MFELSLDDNKSSEVANTNAVFILLPFYYNHLVVEPAMHEVREVVAASEVGGGQHLAQVEGARVGLAVHVEAVQVVARVVGGDHDERVDVGGHFGEEQRVEGIHGVVGAAVVEEVGGEERHGGQQEPNEEVRREHFVQELSTRKDERETRAEEGTGT